jgi:uncharacterized membrane protein YcaP (DUF421 family)
MYEILIYMARCVIMLFITWSGIRLLGKKTIAQMTAYELAGMLLLTTVAAEPLVVKVAFKATSGVLILGLCTMGIGWLSLRKFFYNLDSKPGIAIVNGRIDKNVLKKSQMNLPFFLSLLREKGIFSVSQVQYAIIEPNGSVSIIPGPQDRPVTPKDLNLQTQTGGIGLPLIIDGEIQRTNLDYAGLDMNWLDGELRKAGAASAKDVLLAELNADGSLFTDMQRKSIKKPSLH